MFEITKRMLFAVVLLTLTHASFAQDLAKFDLEYNGNPAKDLINPATEEVYTKRELIDLYATGFDLSLLNPKLTDVWDGKSTDITDSSLDNLEINQRKSYDYVEKIAAPIGSFRFSIRDRNSSNQKHYSVWVAKDSRANLLRKNILRKLGYKVPKISQTNKLKLKFNGLVSLNSFIEDLELATFADSARWKVSQNDNTFELTLQDVLVIESNFIFYDLSLGQLPGIVNHRRVLNSLLIPYAVTDVRESVDGLSWDLGKVDNKKLLLDTVGSTDFTTTANDAKWILRKMAKFTHNDFKEIVDQAFYPSSVGTLLVEKLKSRFISLYRSYNMPDGEISHLTYNANISDRSGELKRGRLTINNWEGHAARYSFEDTESPLSTSEIKAYFKSRVYSAMISNLVSYFNDNYLYETDIQEEAIKQQIQAKQNQIINLLETGQYERIPFSTWAIPTAKGHINASRDIVTGSYLGTDNRIQIADTLEFVGGLGVFVGTLGLPTEYQAYATAGVQLSRAYTHVKSIKSIKKALKEPYRNILVPSYKNGMGNNLQSIIEQLQSEEFTSLEEEEKSEKLGDILKGLKDVMEVGESLIISTNLMFSGAITGGVSYEIVDAILNLNLRKVNLWRYHLVRTDENTIQIYKSNASSFAGGFALRLNVYMPILSYRYTKNKGTVRTMFNQLSINKGMEVKDLVRNLTEFKQLITDNSPELLNARKKPFYIDHNFKEKSTDSSFLHNKSIKIELTDNIKLTHPEGFETDIIVRSTGKLKGKDYMQVAVDALNSVIEEVLDYDNIEINNPGSGVPGDTYKGKSFSRVTTYEEAINIEDTDIPFTPYAEIKSQWKGWSAGPNTLSEIQSFIENKYGRDIFPDDIFLGTRQIQLYNVDVIMSIYERGLQNLIRYTPSEFENILRRYMDIPNYGNLPMSTPRSRRGSIVRESREERVIRKAKQAYDRLKGRRRLSAEDKAKYMEQIVNVCELTLPFNIFKQMLGGDEHFYLKGYVNGFRVGVENGEEPLISHSLGEYDSELTKGTFNTIREAIKISQGELGAYWFLRRIQ